MVNLSVNGNPIDNVRLIIFDKDGTLMDLYSYWSNMVAFRVDMAQEKLGFNERHKKDIMYAMGVDHDNGRLRSEGPVGLKKREIVLQAMADAIGKIGFENMQDLCQEVFKEVDILSIKRFSDIVRPVNNMHHMIDTLKKKKCKIAVATTDKTERAELAMKHLGVLNKIDAIIGDDMVKNSKPFPDMVNLILNKLRVENKNAVMVGDAITDVEMGINAGLLASIGVCSGLTPRDKLRGKTKYVIDDISKIGIEG